MTGRICEAENGQPPGVQEFVNAGGRRAARDIPDVHLLLRDYPDDVLEQIPILSVGARLVEGATYLDLRNPSRCPFTATGDMEAGPNHYYIPKCEVPIPVWCRLIGVLNPARTDCRAASTEKQ